MIRLVLVRLVSSIPVLLAAALVTSILFEVIPGDAALAAIGDRATAVELAAVRTEMGLDAPPVVRVARSLARLARGDLGRSLRTGRTVADEVAERLPFTLALSGAAVGLAMLLGPLAGAAGAAHRQRWPDLAITGAASLVLAAPVFAVALPLIALFSLTLGVLPVAGSDALEHGVLPVVTLALPSIAAVTRVSRASFLEALAAEYVRTAHAKGLPVWQVYARHMWPNAAPAVLALTGVHLGSLLGGAVVVETLFAWPGLGRLAVTAILARDYPVAHGTVLTLAVGFVAANLLADLAQRSLDPRLRAP